MNSLNLDCVLENETSLLNGYFFVYFAWVFCTTSLALKFNIVSNLFY